MEDLFKFLLVAAVIAIGLVRQFKKEAKKNSESKPVMPLPDTDMNDDVFPPYSDQGNTYGGYIPQGPPMTKQSTEENVTRPIRSKSKKATTSSYTSIQTAKSSPITEIKEPDETSEYGIHSAEEARRAIIWSEIIQRKY
jgi:hypothetical protein